MRKKTKRWIPGIVVGLVLLLAWIVLLSPWVWPAPGMDSLVVGRETTWLENPPMNPDGTVNYMKAMADRMMAGVTPENNAMVCFIQAIRLDRVHFEIDGEPSDDDETRQKFLGQPASAITGPFLTDIYDVMRKIARKTRPDVNGVSIEEHFLISPWSDEEYPLLREWVDRNAKPLGWMVEGSKRPRCSHIQRCEGEDSVIVADMHGEHELDAATRGLLIRAMGSLSQGKLQRAWDDTMAVRRIARLYYKGNGSALVAMGRRLENDAIKAQQSILASDTLQLDQTTAWLGELQALPQLPDASIARDIGVLQILSKTNGLENPNDGRMFLFEQIILMSDDGWPDHVPNLSPPLIMQLVVKSFRDEETVANLPTVLERKYAELDAIRYWYAKPYRLGPIITLALGTPIARQRALIRMISASVRHANPELPLPWTLLRSIPQTRSELTRVMAAMAVYRAKHKQWPARLSDLVPAILPRVPVDPWSDSQSPLKYKRTPEGFLLYSIGYNETDDGGQNNNSSKGIYGMQEGDISISVPPAKQPDEQDK